MYSINIYHGPNKYSNYQSVVVNFEIQDNPKISLSKVKSLWELLTDNLFYFRFNDENNISISELICAFAVNLQHPDDVESAEFHINENFTDKASSLAIRFIDYKSTVLVIKHSIELTTLIISSNRLNDENIKIQKYKIKNLQVLLRSLLPQNKTIRTLVREAKNRSIPVRCVAQGSGIWMFGQGESGHHFYEAATESDSFTGMVLQKDKLLSNRLIKELGLPGVTHLVASNQKDLSLALNKIGYPLVIKPISSGMGNGVTADIRDDAELIMAFNKAIQFSQRGVIVEKFIPGNDYRLAVFGGKVQWIAKRSPAKITGDGITSIQNLIISENKYRSELPIGNGLQQIPLDSNLIDFLKKQNLSLGSVLTKNMIISLSSIANVSKGGSVEEILSSIHRDNIEMAESIARAFRMDALGIDFISKDISISWRDTPSAVIEVNGTPGIFYDDRAGRILDIKFPKGHNPRVPCVMVIDMPVDLSEKIYKLISEDREFSAKISKESTLLKGLLRCRPGDTLPERINAVLIDKACQALFIENTSESIDTMGLPLDHFDLVISYSEIDNEKLNILKKCSDQIINAESGFEFIEKAIKNLMNQPFKK